MQRQQQQLANGLTLIGEHEPTARSLAAGFFVRTGARDESSNISGVSHFLEHMMFKGTARRTPEAIKREFDAMGARYNAFTSDENTVYYGHVLPRFQARLTDLLADMMRPALRQDDFEVEKKVILEEIAMYQDRPQFQVFDLTRATYFGDHPLGASVLGTTDSIRSLQREQMEEYFRRRYAANNLTFTLTGNYDWDLAVQQLEQSCGDWNMADAPRDLSEVTPAPAIKVEATDKFNRAHVYLMAPGYAAQDERRYAAAVAAEALGAGDGSRLYWALVHPGLSEAAQIGHDASDGVGVFYGYLLADPQRTQAALDTLRATLAEACSDGLQEAEIERAKRRLASRLVLGAETPMGRLRPVGMDWIYRQEQKAADAALQALLEVTVEEVNDVLAAQPFEVATIVGLGPLPQLH